MLKCLPKGKNSITELCQQTGTVQCMYLAFKELKLSSKTASSGQKAKSKVPTIFDEVKIQKDRCR